MLPERLSNNLTSLNLNEDRIAVIVEMEIDVDGTVRNSDVYQAQVRNHAIICLYHNILYHHVHIPFEFRILKPA